MTDPEMLSWLRQAITERLELARKATPVPWEAEGDDPTDDEIVIDDGSPGLRLVIFRGPDSHANMLHAAANDPQGTIARCEAELAILDLHKMVIADAGDSYDQARGQQYRVVNEDPDEKAVERLQWSTAYLACRECRRRCPCRTVRLLAAGYRHRPGRKAEWASA